MKKILVPTDFSEQAQNATEVATDIAKKLKAEIVLLHVIEQPSSSSFSAIGEAMQGEQWEDKLFMLKQIESAKIKLEKSISKIREAGAKATSELRIGNPFHGIRAIIEDEKAYLVVMGTQGHSRWEEMVIGSNTEKVIRHSKCPILTVKKKSPSMDFRNFVVAVSLITDDDQLTTLFRDLQKAYDAVLNLVWINTPGTFQADAKSLELLQQFADKKKLRNYTLNVYNDYSIEEGILNFSELINSDLIAMITHKRNAFAQVLAGGVRSKVNRKTGRPVLTWLID